jgi:pimeloyl-ACP methyl ester carboxylesterase
MSEPVLGELGVAWSRTRAGAIQRAWPKALLLFGRPWLAPAGWLAEQYRLACRPRFLFLDTTLAALRDQVGLAGQRRVLLERLGGLEVPVLLVWGAQDRVVPVAHARRAAARLPDARWWCCLLRAPAARGGPGPFNRTLTAFLNAPRSHGRAPASA